MLDSFAHAVVQRKFNAGDAGELIPGRHLDAQATGFTRDPDIAQRGRGAVDQEVIGCKDRREAVLFRPGRGFADHEPGFVDALGKMGNVELQVVLAQGDGQISPDPGPTETHRETAEEIVVIRIGDRPIRHLRARQRDNLAGEQWIAALVVVASDRLEHLSQRGDNLQRGLRRRHEPVIGGKESEFLQLRTTVLSQKMQLRLVDFKTRGGGREPGLHLSAAQAGDPPAAVFRHGRLPGRPPFGFIAAKTGAQLDGERSGIALRPGTETEQAQLRRCAQIDAARLGGAGAGCGKIHAIERGRIVRDHMEGAGIFRDRHKAVHLHRRDARESQAALVDGIVAQQFALLAPGDEDEVVVPREPVERHIAAGRHGLGEAAVGKPEQLAAAHKPFGAGRFIHEDGRRRLAGPRGGGRRIVLGLGGFGAIHSGLARTRPERNGREEAAIPGQQIADFGVALLGQNTRRAAGRGKFIDVALGRGTRDDASVGETQQPADIAVANLTEKRDAAGGEGFAGRQFFGSVAPGG